MTQQAKSFAITILTALTCAAAFGLGRLTSQGGGSASLVPPQSELEPSDPTSQGLKTSDAMGPDEELARVAASAPSAPTQDEAETLERQPVRPWAHFHPLAEQNARARIELIEFNERRLQEPDLSNYMRATYLYRLAKVAIYTIEDFERTSTYPGEPGYEINPTAGQPVSKNGGALYRIPAGKYAVFDLLDRSSDVRQEICRADIDHLVRRANELLEPYSER